MEWQVRSVEDELEEGEELQVLCQGRDSRGHVKVSRKALLPPPAGSGAPTASSSRPAPTGLLLHGRAAICWSEQKALQSCKDCLTHMLGINPSQADKADKLCQHVKNILCVVSRV